MFVPTVSACVGPLDISCDTACCGVLTASFSLARLYVMFEDWPTLSQKTRLELRKMVDGGYERVEHRGDWQKSLARVINQKRDERE